MTEREWIYEGQNLDETPLVFICFFTFVMWSNRERDAGISRFIWFKMTILHSYLSPHNLDIIFKWPIIQVWIANYALFFMFDLVHNIAQYMYSTSPGNKPPFFFKFSVKNITMLVAVSCVNWWRSLVLIFFFCFYFYDVQLL